MLITDKEEIPEQNFIPLGLVRGMAAINKKYVPEGDLDPENEYVKSAFDYAQERMMTEAEEAEADAVVGAHTLTEPVDDSTIGVIAYGIAVRFI